MIARRRDDGNLEIGSDGSGRRGLVVKPEISFGNILTLVAMLAGIGASGLSLWSGIESKFAEVDVRFATIEVRLDHIENPPRYFRNQGGSCALSAPPAERSVRLPLERFDPSP